MIKTTILFLILFSLACCHSGKDAPAQMQEGTITGNEHQIPDANQLDTTFDNVTVSIKENIRKSTLKGLWTDGTTDGAVFEIKDNTFFYVDENSEYTYRISGDTIRIQFSDYTYEAQIRLEKDTLMMNAEAFGESKFWRVKN